MEHDANAENPDAHDAEKIYRLLEDQIIPLYYQMSEKGIPLEWVRLMKETIKNAAAGFSARRMVKQYIEKFYSTGIKNALYHREITDARLIRLSKAFDAEPPWCAKEGNVN